MDLARSFVLGCDEDAGTIASLMMRGFTDGLFYEPGGSRVVPYVLSLYTQAKALPPPQFKSKIVEDPVYVRLISSWASHNVGEITEALTAACHRHVECAKYDTYTDMYEFCTTEYNLQPVEILMVLRMRELQGMSTPIINHPVMNTPVARLFPVRRVEPDPMLAAAFAAGITNIEEMREQMARTR